MRSMSECSSLVSCAAEPVSSDARRCVCAARPLTTDCAMPRRLSASAVIGLGAVGLVDLGVVVVEERFVEGLDLPFDLGVVDRLDLGDVRLYRLLCAIDPAGVACRDRGEKAPEVVR